MPTSSSRDRDEVVPTTTPNALTSPVIAHFESPSQHLIGTFGGRDADLVGIGMPTPRSRDRDEVVPTTTPNALTSLVIAHF